MRTRDLRSSLFWLLLAIIVLIASIRMGVGRPGNPGMGFMSFGASGLLGILSVLLFLRAHVRKEQPDALPVAFFSGPWRNVLLVLGVLTLYSVVMPHLGYLISTFLLLTVLFWIMERASILQPIIFSACSTFLTYLVFSKWLNLQFPEGLFSF
jgi:putative tricarboxylic transport membrane protein